jgi:trehalose utilization protein
VVAAIYPKGIHGLLAEVLGQNDDFIIRTATLDEPEQGCAAGGSG